LESFATFGNFSKNKAPAASGVFQSNAQGAPTKNPFFQIFFYWLAENELRALSASGGQPSVSWPDFSCSEAVKMVQYHQYWTRTRRISQSQSPSFKQFASDNVKSENQEHLEET